MQSKASTVAQYLLELPEDRREAVKTVRATILEHLPEGYEEVMSWGMIAYQVPLETYPDTYNKKPLPGFLPRVRGCCLHFESLHAPNSATGSQPRWLPRDYSSTGVPREFVRLT